MGSLETGSTGRDAIVQMMIGRTIETAYPPRTHELTTNVEPALSVESLKSGAQVRDVTLTVNPGEIVGLYGLVGAGRSETLQAIFGLRRIDGGSLMVLGRRLPANHVPTDSMAAGISFLPEDRATEGLFYSRSIAENLFAPQLRRFGRWLIRDRRMRSQANPYIKRFSIKGSPQTTVGDLSGGNQQKVLFARWSATSPRIFMVDEPTRGVDVGTKVSIHKDLRAMANEGKAIVMVSSELPEVTGMSDRIYVFAAGRTVDSFTKKEAEAARLLKSASRFSITASNYDLS